MTIILKNYIKEIPLIIGNNRDELSRRNFIPPSVISENPYIVGGIDLLKGGTWLGVNDSGVVVNILNKFKGINDFYGSDSFKSRGLLVKELLELESIDKILNSLRHIDSNEYLPFFLIIADKEQVFFVEYDNYISFTEIKEDLFIAGNLNPFDRTWEKYETGYSKFENLKDREFNKVLNELKSLLKYHTGDMSIPSTDFSVNLGDFCTTSSTILVFKEKEKNYFFANGSPLNTEYQNYSFLINNI